MTFQNFQVILNLFAQCFDSFEQQHLQFDCINGGAISKLIQNTFAAEINCRATLAVRCSTESVSSPIVALATASRFLNPAEYNCFARGWIIGIGKSK